MKNKIVIEKEARREPSEKDKLHFYLHCSKGRQYLFTQDFSMQVYQFFAHGRSENEILGYKKWSRNRRLNKTIQKIPMYVNYVLKEIA